MLSVFCLRCSSDASKAQDGARRDKTNLNKRASIAAHYQMQAVTLLCMNCLVLHITYLHVWKKVQLTIRKGIQKKHYCS